MKFDSLEEAAKGLLITTCEILNGTAVSYVVAGGWIPVSEGGSPALRHPGTRDVDILFSYERESIVNAAQKLLASGFNASAKHEFQLLRPIKVVDRQFIFNVDLMHQGEFRGPDDLFSDIFDLGIPDAYDPTGKRWLKSVIFASSAIIFEERLWSPFELGGRDADGVSKVVPIPLMDEAALILSKVESVRQPKRTRDAFDIFFVISGPSAYLIEARLREMSSRFPRVAKRLSQLKDWIAENPEKFDVNVQIYAADCCAPSRVVVGSLDRILAP